MQKIKIIAISCIAYMGIGFAALHTADAELSATTYTNHYYRFYDYDFWGGGYVASSHVYAVTSPNTTSCLNGYFGLPPNTVRPGEWRYEYTAVEPIAFACLP